MDSIKKVPPHVETEPFVFYSKLKLKLTFIGLSYSFVLSVFPDLFLEDF